MAVTPRPSRQSCQICSYDDDVELIRVEDDWVFTCRNPGHPLWEWRPKAANERVSYRSGIGEELGVYDVLLECVADSDRFTEYGVIEHRFAQRAPKIYDLLIRRYGHTYLTSTKYTTSAFLGGALGHLWREESVDGRWGPATGYWKYNGQIGMYAPLGTADDADELLWEDYAAGQLGVDPLSWPALEGRP